jgi:hypothetical protein
MLIRSLDGNGNTVGHITIPGASGVHTVDLTGEGIASVVLTGGGGEGALVEVCIDAEAEPTEPARNVSSIVRPL